MRSFHPMSSAHSSSPHSRSSRSTDADYRLMVDAVSDYAIFMLDPTAASAPGTPARSGSRATPPTKSSAAAFELFYPQRRLDAGWPQHELREAMRIGRFEDEGWRLRKDGSRFWANVVITALHDDDGTPPRLRQGHPRPHRAARARRTAAPERGAFPPDGGRRARLRHLHARSRRPHRQLEPRRADHQGLHRRGDHRPALLRLLPAGDGRRAAGRSASWRWRCATAASRTKAGACARTAAASGPAS